MSLNALVSSFISAAIGLDATQTKALPQQKTKLAPAIKKARGKAAARSEAKGRRCSRAKVSDVLNTHPVDGPLARLK